MSAKKIYDLAAVVGSYTDNQGKQKHRYQNIGVILQKEDGGKFIMMDRSFNPAGVPYDASRGNTILISMFEPKQESRCQQAQGAQAEEFSDSIPF